MNKKDICEKLSEKKYSEVISNRNLRKQFLYCLNNNVFKINGICFSFDENLFLQITLPVQFFNHPAFRWGGRPSDTRIKRFYEILKKLEREFEGEFLWTELKNLVVQT